MRGSWKAVFLMVGLAFLFLRPGWAEEPSEDETLSPYFFVEGGDPAIDRLPLKETKADVHIAGVIADVVVTQVYRNEGSRPINARYIFPASTRAAVHGMTMQIGEHRIRAEIREKQEARLTFEQAQKDGKNAALLEQQRPNVFSMNVANVMPQDEIRVELHYSEILVPTDGTYEFVYPTVVGPRYAGGLEKTISDDVGAWVKSPYQRQGEAPGYTFDIQASVAAGMPIDEVLCPSHKTNVEWRNAATARVTLDPTEAGGGNRDYILRYRLQGRQVETGLLLYPGEEENFFLLMVQPPRRVEARQIPPREYIFVLDVSGSMHGFPLDTAKELMRRLLGGLRPADSFNVILFSGGSRLLAPESLPATQANIRQAINVIDQETGGGGTELGEALERALALPGNDGVSRTTIVVTDGFIGAEAGVFERIRTRLNESNLFAFGIGSSVNRHLIEGMARAGQGEPFIVTKPEEAGAVAKGFQKYIQSPVLTDIAVDMTGFETYDIEPASYPDLFAERPLVVFGKWRGEASGTIRVTGLGGDGHFEKVLDVAEAEESPRNEPLRYLWARARVARLSDEGFETDEVRAAVTEIGLTYELLTAYTSFIAVHEEVRNTDGTAKDVDQPLPMPEGVSDFAVGSSVPEPELPLLLALVLLLLVLTPAGRAWLKGLAR